MFMEDVVHHCMDCAHDQKGTLNLITGQWTCGICGHIVTFTEQELGV